MCALLKNCPLECLRWVLWLGKAGRKGEAEEPDERGSADLKMGWEENLESIEREGKSIIFKRDARVLSVGAASGCWGDEVDIRFQG